MQTGDGEESSCSISVLESDNAELISRLTSLQKKHEEIVDHVINVIFKEKLTKNYLFRMNILNIKYSWMHY